MSQTVTDMRASFNAGELSRRMEGRTDTAIYRIGAATVENFAVTVEGPLAKCPGFRFVRPAAATASWVSRFVFSRTQSYLLEWSANAIRFYTNGGRIETGPTTPYEVATPYTAAEAPAVSRQQSFDRQYLAHRAHPTAALTRTSATTFAYAALDLQNGPFDTGNADQAITVSASATTGSVTITAASPIFDAGDVGGLFMLEALDFSNVPAWEVGIDGIAIGALRRSNGKVYTAATAGRTGTAAPAHEDGTEWDGSQIGNDINGKGPYGVKWAYRHDRFGVGRITAVASATQATLLVSKRLPDSLISVASWRWTFGAFSTRRGWPNVVAIWNQRLILVRDYDVFGSVVGAYLNFQSYTSTGLITADLAFRYRLASADPVLWVVPDVYLLLGTASGEYPLGALNTGAAAGPGNLGVRRPSFYGANATWPLQIGTSMLFTQRGGRTVREGAYDYNRDALVADNITVWARQMSKGGIRQLAYMQLPEALLWCLRGDGQLALRAHAPEQEVKGWSRRVHGGGLFVSADTLPADDGNDDELWALVDRGGVKSIEQMASFWDEDEDVQADAFFVDSGLSATFSPPQQHITGLAHLAGRDVAVLADGAVVPNIIVAGDGSIDLPFAASKVTVGLPYTARFTSLRLEAETRGGTAQGKRKRLVNAILRLIDASAGLRAGSIRGKLDQVIRRGTADRMDKPVPLFNGDTDGVSLGGGWDREGQITIEHSDPTPCMLTAVMPRYEVSDT